MNKKIKAVLMLAAAVSLMPAYATIEGSLDPPSVVAQWSNSSTYPKVIDINFSDTAGLTLGREKRELTVPTFLREDMSILLSMFRQTEVQTLHTLYIYTTAPLQTRIHTMVSQELQQHSAVSTIWDKTGRVTVPRHTTTGLLPVIPRILRTTYNTTPTTILFTARLASYRCVATEM